MPNMAPAERTNVPPPATTCVPEFKVAPVLTVRDRVAGIVTVLALKPFRLTVFPAGTFCTT